MFSEEFFTQNHFSKNQQILLPILEQKGVELFIKREDKIHPDISGNKFRKLKYNILEAKQKQKSVLLTFGGAYSNHILAVAIAGKIAGFKTVGVVRGEELANDLENTLETNPTLQKAFENEMEFVFISREQYRNKYDANFLNKLKEKFEDFYLVPEGGTNDLAIKGCEEILTAQDSEFDYICCAVGTGGTISGLINASENHQQILGFPALKGDFLTKEINRFVRKQNWTLVRDYHFGGYAKYTDELIRFINDFKQKTNILLDPIYTGKMVFGICDMITKNHFKKGSKILVIHTGGLQGITGFNQQLKKKNKEIISI